MLKFLFFGLMLVLAGCQQMIEPRAAAHNLAHLNRFSKVLVKTNPYLLTTYQKIEKPTADLMIYVEGDGRSWISRSKISPDPTPHNPIGLKLAIQDPSPNVVYLARPCQYTPHTLDFACHPSVWTMDRFSKPVITAMNQAVEHLKNQTQAKKIHLVGFSGGAAIAVLIASQRQDIASLRTVAGDLDHQLLTEYHQTTPLMNALNPKAVVTKIANVPQHHFAGERDPIVPPFISQTFAEAVSSVNPHCVRRTLLADVEHHGFEDNWSSLLKLPVDCEQP